MVIYKCNRCKKEIAPVHSRNQKYDIYRNRLYNAVSDEPDFINGNELIHLCPECTKAFDKFLEGEEVKSHVIPNETLIGPMGGLHYADV